MSLFFSADFGELEVHPWFADNETVVQEVRFSVPASLWSEFQESDLFRELKAYVESLRTQDM